jgi:hypothetical protein
LLLLLLAELLLLPLLAKLHCCPAGASTQLLCMLPLVLLLPLMDRWSSSLQSFCVASILSADASLPASTGATVGRTGKPAAGQTAAGTANAAVFLPQLLLAVLLLPLLELQMLLAWLLLAELLLLLLAQLLLLLLARLLSLLLAGLLEWHLLLA